MTNPHVSSLDWTRAHQQRVQAVMDCGFTKRQARFLVLVMRHAGVCVPRQYANAAGIANGGRRCNAFFDWLVRRGLAREIPCVHNRARLYLVHHKPLYFVIGEVSSRHRRTVSPRLAVERLMLLDAVLALPDVEWLTTAAEKAALLERLRTDASVGAAGAPSIAVASHPAPQLPSASRSGSSQATAWCSCLSSPSLTSRRSEPSSRRTQPCCARLRCGRSVSPFRARSIGPPARTKPSSMRNSSRRYTRRPSAS